jgi:BioD-like phosphotransacetylase family protein
MKSIVYESANKEVLANQARIAASEAQEQGAQCTKYLKSREIVVSEISLPFQHFADIKKRLLTGSSRRLNLFLQKQIAQIID